MPYKSRQAKISATQRRFNYIKTGQDGSFVYENKQKLKEGQAQNSSSEGINDSLFLKSDILKIIILSLLIISGQIALRLTLS